MEIGEQRKLISSGRRNPTIKKRELRDHHPWNPDSGLSYHPSTGYMQKSTVFFSSLAWSPRKLSIWQKLS
jgi:hypothetical protein